MSDRIYKINELIKVEAGQILQKEIILEDGVLTVTAVETTNDLRQAIVWLGFFGNNKEEVENLISEKAKDIQKKINHRLTLKHVPKLEYKFDKSGEYADEIGRVLRKISQ